ncbi:MAG: hypothetical protein KIT84_33970 [Labilithrix sp.]|nr:hypothetical protein [Labilithrix sp.]MCW5816055.1 hypothetical protein [Labilithrix sp.]
MLGVGACGSTALEPTPGPNDGGPNLRWDSALVDPVEGGAPLDSAPPVEASCEKYCELVTENCTEANAQYASKAECLSFCEHLPLREPSRGGDEISSPSVACRQYWADAPSKTSPTSYCLAAGPFGGNTCGDRCTAFCTAVLSICPADAPNAPYADQPECATACTAFAFRDAGNDGGGESPGGPAEGDTLNCRLHHLRAALSQPAKCKDVRRESPTCKD